MSVSRGDIKMAIGSVRGTRGRSLLTTFGIIIGICSVVTTVSIGEGIKHQITAQVNQLGKDLIIVRPGIATGQSTSQALNALNVFGSANAYGGLSTQDEQVVQKTPGVSAAAPMSIVPGVVEADGQRGNASTFVVGTSDNAASLLNQTLQYGDFFSSSDASNDTAILGSAAAEQLFPGEVPLGRSFTFHGQQFIVRGEFNQFDAAPLSLDADFNNGVFIPYSAAQQLENNVAPLYEILARPTSSSTTSSVIKSIQSRLLQAHGGVQNFSVLGQQNSLAASNNILALLTKLISGIAAVSLLVGGIGVMNVMLVTVTERTHEIGIRKALGATNRQIRNQFMTEAAVLSLFGGLIGIIGSLLINVGLRILTSLQPAISWEIVALATVISLAVGVIFGIAPALKAAHKDPIEALRYYQ